MANENQEQRNIRLTAEALRAGQTDAVSSLVAADQAEANKAFKESINLLNKINKLIDESNSKTNSFEKSTINIKKIEQERERIERKRKTLITEIGRASQQDQNAAKDYLQKIQERERLENRLARTQGIQRLSIQQQLNNLNQTIEADERRLAGSKEQLDLVAKIQSQEALKERVDLLEDELKIEEKIAKQVGNTGAFLKTIGKVLPGANNLYKKMVEEARNGEVKTKGLVIAAAALAGTIALVWKGFKKFVDLADQGLRALTGSGGPVSSFVSPFTNLIKQIPFIGGFLGGLVDAFANLIDFATGANSEVQKFARNLGISVEDAKKLTDKFDQLARSSGQAFITVEKLRKSQTELSGALGLNNILSNEILAADAQIAEQVGLDLETRKELAVVAGVIGKTQTNIFTTIAAQNKLLANNLGVNLRVQDVIKKASSFAGVLGLTFAKYPEKLSKSLLITKALGMDLQKLDSMASGLLDFESSISKEFEAQLLSGKNINLMKARELALNNNLTGLAVELNKQLGTSEEFLKSNRLIQEAYADATQMSRDEIADMLKKQELFAKIGATDLKTFREKVAQMEKAGTLQSEFVSKLKEEQAEYFLSSTATEKIASFMDKIRQSFANLLNNPGFQGLIDMVIKKLSDPNFINNVISKLTGFVSLLLRAVAGVISVMDAIGNKIPFLNVDIDDRISGQIKAIASDLGSISLTGNALRTQTSGVGTQTNFTQTAGTGASVTHVHNHIMLDDHARVAQVRYGKAPQNDQQTGQIGKGQ